MLLYELSYCNVQFYKEWEQSIASTENNQVVWLMVRSAYFTAAGKTTAVLERNVYLCILK